MQFSQAEAVFAPERRTRLSALKWRPHLYFTMTNTMSTGAAAIAHEMIDRISINQRAGIWRVALNGDFYGDYSRRYWALEAAFEKADAIAERGGAAIITWTIGGQHDTLLYDTRSPSPRENAERLINPRSRSARRWPRLVGETLAQRVLA